MSRKVHFEIVTSNLESDAEYDFGLVEVAVNANVQAFKEKVEADVKILKMHLKAYADRNTPLDPEEEIGELGSTSKNRLLVQILKKKGAGSDQFFKILEEKKENQAKQLELLKVLVDDA